MALIDRAAALALINTQNMGEVFEGARQESAALRTFRTIPMSTRNARMPVLDTLPSAGFLASDNTAKPTTAMQWRDKTLVAEEIAVIVPIPENVFDDAEYDVWGTVRPRISEAVGVAIDAAVFFGVGKPTSWPNDLLTGAVTAGNVVSETATTGDLAEDFNQTINLVEADGFEPDTIWSNRRLRARLRGLRDTQNRPIYDQSAFRANSVDTIYGLNLEWVRNGSWTGAGGTQAAPTGATAIVGDSQAAILGIRQDIEFKMLSEATVGGFNLAEQDMIALRCKMRVAFQVADPITREGGTGAYPFAALRT